jgi:catechol 2,3-dioxygenase-like lactoylglutathione lyase family enzyme
MNADPLTTVLAVSDMPAAIRAWRSILGAEPTFVDGERWAQFNVGSIRIALAGADQASRAPSLMFKVEDLEAQRARLLEAGVSLSVIQTGPHERYFEAHATDGWRATFYAAL